MGATRRNLVHGHDRRASASDKFDTVPPVYAELTRHLVQVEEVNVNVWDRGMEESVRAILAGHKVPLARVHFHPFPAYEPWCRDHGPIFLVRAKESRRERAVVDWAYNAWGGKYPPFDLDDAVPQHVAKLRGLPLFSPGIVMEGGALDVNGRGTLLTTKSCLLNPNRNPGLPRPGSSAICGILGVRNIIWLGDGIAGDDTDGHVDDLSRFINPTTIVTVVEQDSTDENHAPLQENRKRCVQRAIRMASRFASNCRCPLEWSIKASGCLQVTQTSISPTGLSWSRRIALQATGKRSRSSSAKFRSAESSGWIRLN
jgi:agmatine deiminase